MTDERTTHEARTEERHRRDSSSETKESRTAASGKDLATLPQDRERAKKGIIKGAREPRVGEHQRLVGGAFVLCPRLRFFASSSLRVFGAARRRRCCRCLRVETAR